MVHSLLLEHPFEIGNVISFVDLKYSYVSRMHAS